MSAGAWADLAACLGGVPRLERAACKGRADVFDLTPDSPAAAIDRAKAICDTVCQVQPACAAWVASTPPAVATQTAPRPVSPGENPNK